MCRGLHYNSVRRARGAGKRVEDTIWVAGHGSRGANDIDDTCGKSGRGC